MQSKKDDKVVTSKSAYQNLPQALINRLFERQSRFNGLELSETEIDEIVRNAASQRDLDLDLSGAVLGREGGLFVADAISRNNFSYFIHMNLNNTKISREGFEGLMYVAVEFRSLETLSVRSNDLPKEAGLSLAKVMGAKGKLRVLDIQENNLGDTGIAAIAGAFTADLREIPPKVSVSLLTLEELDLSSNHFGDAAVLALCRGLSHFGKHCLAIDRLPCLRVLRINKNNLGDKAAMCLAQFLQSTGSSGSIRIEELSVNDNPIGFRGLISLLGAAQEGARTSLQILNMARCRPNLSVLDMAALVMGSTSQLRVVDLSLTETIANEISQESGFTETLTRLAAAVGSNAELNSLNLGELPEVLRKALNANQIGSSPYQKIRDALDALRSMQDILRLTASLQASIAQDLNPPLATPHPTPSSSSYSTSNPPHLMTTNSLPFPTTTNNNNYINGTNDPINQNNNNPLTSPFIISPPPLSGLPTTYATTSYSSYPTTASPVIIPPPPAAPTSLLSMEDDTVMTISTSTALEIEKKEFERTQQAHADEMQRLSSEIQKLISPSKKARPPQDSSSNNNNNNNNLNSSSHRSRSKSSQNSSSLKQQHRHPHHHPHKSQDIEEDTSYSEDIDSSNYEDSNATSKRSGRMSGGYDDAISNHHTDRPSSRSRQSRRRHPPRESPLQHHPRSYDNNNNYKNDLLLHTSSPSPPSNYEYPYVNNSQGRHDVSGSMRRQEPVSPLEPSYTSSATRGGGGGSVHTPSRSHSRQQGPVDNNRRSPSSTTQGAPAPNDNHLLHHHPVGLGSEDDDEVEASDEYSQQDSLPPSPTHLDIIVQRAVRQALASSLLPAIQRPPPQVTAAAYTPSEATNTDKLHQVVARLDVLQDRLQNLEAQNIAAAERGGVSEPWSRKFQELESRLSRLESQLGSTGNSEESQHSSNNDKANMDKKMKMLSDRLFTLESAVESEHETSLQVLDVLLNQKSSGKK